VRPSAGSHGREENAMIPRVDAGLEVENRAS